MRLSLRMTSKVLTCDWNAYALFRDNVQHFVEGGAPTERFRALHAIEQAVSDGHQSVDAARLRGEVIGGVFALRKLTLQDAAISLRTRAVLTDNARFPDVRATVRASQTGWSLPVAGASDSRLLTAAKPFIGAVLGLTETAVDGDALEVQREGSAPEASPAAPPEPRREHSRFAAVPGLATIGAAALLVACATTPAPRAPAPAAEPALETKLEQPEPEERAPIVAPPPAWGHKVVMTGSLFDRRQPKVAAGKRF